MPQCVTSALVDGVTVIVPDDACTAGLVLVDAATYAAMAQNPLLIPLDAAQSMGFASFGLLVACYLARVSRRALD